LPADLERRPRANDSGESSTVDNDDRFDDESDNDFDHESDNGCDDDATNDCIEEGTADAEEGTAEARCAARCNSDTRNAELHRIAVDEPAWRAAPAFGHNAGPGCPSIAVSGAVSG
jgi:hypothetical protein